jgi:hypothetical protein
MTTNSVPVEGTVVGPDILFEPVQLGALRVKSRIAPLRQ